MYKLKHFCTLKSIACLRSLSSLNEYLASPVTASTGPFSDCCLTALNNINNGSPASFWNKSSQDGLRANQVINPESPCTSYIIDLSFNFQHLLTTCNLHFDFTFCRSDVFVRKFKLIELSTAQIRPSFELNIICKTKREDCIMSPLKNEMLPTCTCKSCFYFSIFYWYGFCRHGIMIIMTKHFVACSLFVNQSWSSALLTIWASDPQNALRL